MRYANPRDGHASEESLETGLLTFITPSRGPGIAPPRRRTCRRSLQDSRPGLGWDPGTDACGAMRAFACRVWCQPGLSGRHPKLLYGSSSVTRSPVMSPISSCTKHFGCWASNVAAWWYGRLPIMLQPSWLTLLRHALPRCSLLALTSVVGMFPTLLHHGRPS